MTMTKTLGRIYKPRGNRGCFSSGERQCSENVLRMSLEKYATLERLIGEVKKGE